MAYQVTFWKMEGKSDIEDRTIRLRKKSDYNVIIDSFLLHRNGPSNRDIKHITLDRTDRQSPICHTLWQASDYKDLNER